MTSSDFKKLSALVIDDFASFRATLTTMLNKLGVQQIEEVVNVPQALKACKNKRFDVILCDYNLGKRRTGQHLLEELRYKKFINHRTLFVMITAESGKDMVLAAYDNRPDDYLIKPLNLRVLEQRLKRLLTMRSTFDKAYEALQNDHCEQAVEYLQSIERDNPRHAVQAQRLLGECYLKNHHAEEAVALYERILQHKELDWAKLGLIKAKHLLNENEATAEQLNELKNTSRMFLPVYDELVNYYEEVGDLDQSQRALEEVTRVSPKSILRQRRLSKVAEKNGDLEVVLRASSAANKLGEFSCHHNAEDAFRFVSAAAAAIDTGVSDNQNQLLEESRNLITGLQNAQGLSAKNSSLLNLQYAHILVQGGDKANAEKIFSQEDRLLKERTRPDIDLDYAKFSYLLAAERFEEADLFAQDMLKAYPRDSKEYEQVDALLAEPKCEQNIRRVSKINRQGIDFYTDGKFEESLLCFQKSIAIFPRHFGLHLNRFQSLLGKFRQNKDSASLRVRVENALKLLSKMASLDASNSQAEKNAQRFVHLKDQAIKMLKGGD